MSDAGPALSFDEWRAKEARKLERYLEQGARTSQDPELLTAAIRAARQARCRALLSVRVGETGTVVTGVNVAPPGACAAHSYSERHKSPIRMINISRTRGVSVDV